MLAQTADPFNSKDHYFEPKWDGMRCIAYLRNHKLELQNRNLAIVTKSYPELGTIDANIKSNTAILDGEIVVLEKGLPNFELLQNRFGVDDPIQVKLLARKIPSTYIVFDLLHLNDKDLVNQPLTERRRRLADIVADGPHILLSQYVAEKGKSYFQTALKFGFEGVMAKKAGSIYQIGTRSEDWLKLKQVKTLDAVVAGYTFGTGSRSSTFGALVLAAYDIKGNLRHLGNVGTGFTGANLTRIMKLLKPLLTKTKTLPGDVKAPAPIKWVKPELVVEVGYMNMTRDHKLRLPRLTRLRFDKKPSECIIAV
jgi:DNA ligase D-like protein (predicted ligase)